MKGKVTGGEWCEGYFLHWGLVATCIMMASGERGCAVDRAT